MASISSLRYPTFQFCHKLSIDAENSASLQGDARWQKKIEKKILVVRRPLKSELLIRRADSLAESTSGEAEQGVERKTQRRWRSGGGEIPAEGTAVTGGRARKGEEARGIRSDRDVRSDLVEGCEKGTFERRRDARRGRGREERTRKEGRKRGDLDEVQEQEDKGKKTGKKGLFELSLCAKQLPGLPGRERWTALCSFTCRLIADTVYRGIDQRKRFKYNSNKKYEKDEIADMIDKKR
ncbi:hypothetical protein DBV15_05800 [Temnothorax longispinosus]|uniref:Uncharacterized protein n=1 Tax=Temnothorax longispinosus TaxID=300112 RepID=A0A4S2L587_9HYME|nr:hypothetical protein DBV15_05800 [Temnothorax longispinosus]